MLFDATTFKLLQAIWKWSTDVFFDEFLYC